MAGLNSGSRLFIFAAGLALPIDMIQSDEFDMVVSPMFMCLLQRLFSSSCPARTSASVRCEPMIIGATDQNSRRSTALPIHPLPTSTRSPGSYAGPVR